MRTGYPSTGRVALHAATAPSVSAAGRPAMVPEGAKDVLAG